MFRPLFAVGLTVDADPELVPVLLEIFPALLAISARLPASLVGLLPERDVAIQLLEILRAFYVIHPHSPPG